MAAIQPFGRILVVTTSTSDTRFRILRAAERLFAAGGYHGTRLREVAAEVGIRRASLFHHFAGKEEIYRAVLEDEIDDTDRRIRTVLATVDDTRAAIRALVSVYVDSIAARPARAKLLLRQAIGDQPGAIAPPDAGRVLAPLVDFIERGQRDGTFAAVDPTALLLSLIGAVVCFFTTAPIVAPEWCRDEAPDEKIARIKTHVVALTERALGVAALDPVAPVPVAARIEMARAAS
jgi:TetR/AcrR family transcriptional regulator